MIRFKFIIIGILWTLIPVSTAFAQQKSVKRGVGWDEKTRAVSASDVAMLKDGVSWLYNWGQHSSEAMGTATDNGEMTFVPMCWNGLYSESQLSAWLKAHPNTKWLLGFNEPNFSSQANMTPAEAAKEWPRLEKIAADYGLKLAAPALNFSGERVGGRTWSPYEWLDAFLEAYPTARIDALVLHSYMNWYSATVWFATEYFYKDLYNPAKTDVYGKYPHIVKYLDTYGKKPMLLTEFCAWEGNKDGFVTTEENQIDQMTQKLQKLEQDTIVAGYAWFIGNGTASAFPYNSITQTTAAGSGLSKLGKVYVNMSSFDTSKYYSEGETIMAKDYVDASTDAYIVRPRPNTESGSSIPLQIELPSSGWAKWQVNAANSGEHQLTVHMKTTADMSLWVYVDGKNTVKSSLASTDGEWADRTVDLKLTAGKRKLMLFNAGSNSVYVNSLVFSETTGIKTIGKASSEVVDRQYYDLSGRKVEVPQPGVYIIVEKMSDGTSNVSKAVRR